MPDASPSTDRSGRYAGASVPHEQSSATTPPTVMSPAGRFDLPGFFAGRTRAWGIFEDRFGRLRRRFSVLMIGRWEADRFVIDEEFLYDTGETEQRQWTVKLGDGGNFQARAADSIGEAVGSCDGTRIHMRYKLRLQISGRVLAVDFDDRIYDMGDGRAVNRATMSKWGVKLGELSLFFVREV